MDHLEKDLQNLIAKGVAQGYLTYDEVNDYLPDEDVNPDKLDNLLIALEERGIELVDQPPKEEFEDVKPGPSARELQQEIDEQEARHPHGRRAAQAQRRSDPHVPVANGRNPAADARRRDFAGQEDRGHAEAFSPHRAQLRLRHAGGRADALARASRRLAV